jgi:SAM-dependent methyltransferase
VLKIHAESLKEVVRHLAFKLGRPDFLDAWRQRRGGKIDHFKQSGVSERFASIYRSGVWKHRAGQQSASGFASELASTGAARAELPSLLAALGCRRLRDVGCGDWNWMRHVRLECDYLGIDIVPSVIQANAAFKRPGVDFRTLDAISEPLPEADVALCRDVLFHLSFADAQAVLTNIRRSARWLVATTDAMWFNSDIRSGDFRVVNLCRRPYRLPEPQRYIIDDQVFPRRRLAAWPTTAIPDYD